MISLIAQIDWDKVRSEIRAVHNIRDDFLPRGGLPGGAGGATRIGDIINLIIPYVFVIAGLILLFMLIMGGIGMMLSANNEQGLKKANGQITNALLGFLMLFISYWLVQIIEAVLGITIF